MTILTIKGVGNIISFKNKKRIFGLKQLRRGLWKGTPCLITAPEVQRISKLIIRSIESQLSGEFRTKGGETTMGCSLPLWIASSMPLDDSLAWMPENHQRVEYVQKGEEGAIIIIEPIKNKNNK
jgi:hypothetical protein